MNYINCLVASINEKNDSCTTCETEQMTGVGIWGNYSSITTPVGRCKSYAFIRTSSAVALMAGERLAANKCRGKRKRPKRILQSNLKGGLGWKKELLESCI